MLAIEIDLVVLLDSSRECKGDLGPFGPFCAAGAGDVRNFIYSAYIIR